MSSGGALHDLQQREQRERPREVGGGLGEDHAAVDRGRRRDCEGSDGNAPPGPQQAAREEERRNRRQREEEGVEPLQRAICVQLVGGNRDHGRGGDRKEQSASVRLVPLHRPVPIRDGTRRIHVDELIREHGRAFEEPAERSVCDRARDDDRREREGPRHAG